MAIEAPLSKYSRNSFLIYIGICLVLAAWFAYDGYLSKRFIEEHTNEQGLADTDLLINRYAPPFLAGAAVVLGLWLCAIRGRKLVADEDGLMISAKKRIPYSAIESIDKTHFEGKGFFTIAYEKGNGTQARCKVSDRQYDNLKAVLEHLVAKIAPEPVSLEQIEAAETGAMASIKQAGGQPLVIGTVVGLTKAIGSLIVVLLFVQETI